MQLDCDPTTIEAVVFDAGGVLLLPDAAAGQKLFRTIGCETTTDDWARALYTVNRVVDAMDEPDWPAVRRAFASAVGVDDNDLDAADALIEEMATTEANVAVSGAAEALSALAAAGYKLAVVSNARGTIAQQLEAHRICSTAGDGIARVEIVVDSHLVGIEKPDPHIFRIALDALGTTPERTIHVGDTIKFDVAGAEAAGLYPVHVDPYALCGRGDSHAHISALAELVEWLVD